MADNRRMKVTELFNAGKINKVQRDSLVGQYCSGRHIALSLSNESIAGGFDQAITLLSQNEEGLYGEQTGIQHPDRIALTNEYIQTEKDIEAARKEDAAMAQPSSTRVSRNGRR